MRPDYRSHFAAVAPRYDALRGERADEVVDLLVAAGDLAGRRVLDLGCGTGATAAALSGRFGCVVTGVDPSAEMLAVARERAPQATFVEGVVEALPLAHATVQRALMQTSVHLVDRRRAFAEVHRVLEPGGRFVIATIDPAHLEAFWLARWFTCWADIDRARFPAPVVLECELTEAGFDAITTRAAPQRLRYSRERALELLRSRFASSFALIDEDEYAAGVARAEREMSHSGVDTVLAMVVLVAQRAGQAASTTTARTVGAGIGSPSPRRPSK